MAEMLRWVGLALIVAVTGCFHVNSRLLSTGAAPEDLYRCLQLELGRAGYAIVGADRASGWLHAQRRIERIHEVVTAEIYATVIPRDGQGSHVQLTDNSHSEADAAGIIGTCGPPAGTGAR